MDYHYTILDGVDGSGKDSQALHLVRRFAERGMDPLLVHEPTDMPTGRLLRQLLKSGEYPEAHAGLFMADRMALQVNVIKPAIEAGRPVVSVRSFLSTLVYQAEHYPLDWLICIHKMLPIQPSHIYVLDVPAEVGMERRLGRELRGGATPEVYEKIDIQRRVRSRYLALLENPAFQEMVKGSFYTVIDGTMDETKVSEIIWRTAVYEPVTGENLPDGTEVGIQFAPSRFVGERPRNCPWYMDKDAVVAENKPEKGYTPEELAALLKGAKL